MIRSSDPRVARIIAQKQAQVQLGQVRRNGRTYRAVTPVAGGSFTDRFPDGAWRGQPCFIIGGGPSLKGFDFSRLKGERVIAINKAFYDAPFADIMFAMDRPLLDNLMSGKLGENYKQAFASFEGAKLWLDLSGYNYPPHVYHIPSAGETGWTKSLSEGLCHGQHSGYGALNLAICLGANPIYLLGYDCSVGPAGEKNYHDGYPSGSNPDAMNIFRKALEAGAACLPPGAPRIVNLNPNSALRCFEFGDTEKVLPAKPPAGPTVTVITPTGDRPLAFRLCQEWMKNQTRKPDQWLVIDDGKTPLVPDMPMQLVRREPQADDPKHTLDLNMATAYPLIRGDKVLIMEDDEYYAPGYIETMAVRLDQAEVVGICRAKYYHLPTGGYVQIGNGAHASLAETGFRRSFLPTFLSCINRGIVPNWLDEQIWRTVNESKRTGRKISSVLISDDTAPLYVGIKGLPGRNGMGMGHNPSMYHSKDTGERPVLRQWAPRDFQVYLDILSGKLTTENYRSYFKLDLPITGITVCWNSKELIERAYNSVRRYYPDLPIIIVDGSNSDSPCAAYTRSLASDKTTVIQPGYNIGHGRGMCLGIENAKTPYALMFDSDIELLEPILPAMLAMMEEDTFGVGYVEKTGADGFVYGVHTHHANEVPVRNLHPYFQLISIGNYKKYYPYVHHGMPTYLTMLDIHKKGLGEKIVKQFPGLINKVPKYVKHDGSGTGGPRIAAGLRHLDGPWVFNQRLV